MIPLNVEWEHRVWQFLNGAQERNEPRPLTTEECFRTYRQQAQKIVPPSVYEPEERKWRQFSDAGDGYSTEPYFGQTRDDREVGASRH